MSAMERFNFEGHVVRVDVDEAGDPWWVLADVCDALGISNSRDLASRVPDEEKGAVGFSDSIGRTQEMTTVNEPGLYRVIFRSNKDEAKRMQHWVFHEVLPAIRKTGQYTHPAAQPKRTPVEVETRHPDGTIVIERYQVGDKPAGNPRPPRALPASSVDVSELRAAFDRALRDELWEREDYSAMDGAGRGKFLHKLNRRMKTITGRSRDEWQPNHYERAVYWLLMEEGVDVRWVLSAREAS